MGFYSFFHCPPRRYISSIPLPASVSQNETGGFLVNLLADLEDAVRLFGWAVRSSSVTARPCASSQLRYHPVDDETQLDADPIIISIYLAVIIIGLLMSMAGVISLMLLGLSAVIPILNNSLPSGAMDKNVVFGLDL